MNKVTAAILPITVTLLCLLALLPALEAQSKLIVGGAAVLAFIQIVLTVGRKETTASVPSPAPAPAAPKPPAPIRPEAEVVGLLARLQEQGRLVDFLMDDINGIEDAQIGAAARVVHQGCRTVLNEHFEIKPVSEAEEGQSVSVPKERTADEYRLTGNLSGQAPFQGVLVHRGWKTLKVKLPELIEGASNDRLPTIAPAEVEIK